MVKGPKLPAKLKPKKKKKENWDQSKVDDAAAAALFYC